MNPSGVPHLVCLIWCAVLQSSLLFIYDDNEHSMAPPSAWMIDFAKTVEVPESMQLNHRDMWVKGNHEDGFLYGIDSLIDFWREVSEGSRTPAARKAEPEGTAAGSAPSEGAGVAMPSPVMAAVPQAVPQAGIAHLATAGTKQVPAGPHSPRVAADL